MAYRSKEEWADLLIIPLYREMYLQTLWNAAKEKNRLEGWTLKNDSWAPWFYNMRPIGDSAKLFHDVCRAMADLILVHSLDVLIGIEMAGVPLIGGTAVASLAYNDRSRRIGYTRPLPEKVRTPQECMDLLRKISTASAQQYGQKEFVEARLRNGDIVGIFDDMANNLGSKLIARLIVLWAAQQSRISVTCNKIFYTLNRSANNRKKATDFAFNPELGLVPAELEVDYIIEFDEKLPKLQKVMRPDEYRVIYDFQNNPGHFQDPDVQKEILALAAKAA
jgi:hypothetical protein